MKSITIKGQERESVGKKATKALRDAGMVPCVIYGGEQPVHFAAEEKAFKGLVYTYNSNNLPLIQTKDNYYLGVFENTVTAAKYYYQGDVLP